MPKRTKKQQLRGFQKGNKLWDNPKSLFYQFKKGNKSNVGKHWKVKDTSKMKGCIPWNKGKTMLLETRKKMSEANKKRPKELLIKNLGKYGKAEKRPDLSGENHWNWKGGITEDRVKLWNSGEYAKWRKKVYERDNYTCQKCGDNSGNNLIPHHKDNFADYPELRFDIDNGIVLCKNCHTYFHSKYGTHHNNREQLNKFLNEEQKSITTKRGRQVMVSCPS